MRNRLLALAAALTLVLAAACSDDDGDATAPDPTDPPAGATGTDPEATQPEAAQPDPGGDTAGEEVVVDVTMSFEPATVEITAGTAVRWASAGGLPHTVTSTSGPMDFDESLPDGGSVTITFDEPGTYEYHCSIHPSMTGTVVVS